MHQRQTWPDSEGCAVSVEETNLSKRLATQYSNTISASRQAYHIPDVDIDGTYFGYSTSATGLACCASRALCAVDASAGEAFLLSLFTFTLGDLRIRRNKVSKPVVKALIGQCCCKGLHMLT